MKSSTENKEPTHAKTKTRCQRNTDTDAIAHTTSNKIFNMFYKTKKNSSK